MRSVEVVMSKRLVCFILITVLAALVLACPAPAPAETVTALGQEVSLAPGQSAGITGENIKFRFERVTEDSRCPTGVVCIWAGQVSCLVQVVDASGTQTIALTAGGLTGDPGKTSYKNYALAFRVEPYPEAGKQIAAQEYRLRLTVSK